jgi:DNA mismatch repair protein MLH1
MAAAAAPNAPHEQGGEDESAAPAPPRIVRLPEDVVNRIAAGEVVVSPAAALKELLENSIDAGATSITVSVRGGGAKLLQVTDNGRGIPPSDLALLCERHATSKLRTFDDLAAVATFGFRGEALASVSHVARVSVLTKTADAQCAQAARYVDGALAAPPTAAAGLAGTALSVEDLFYNLPTRQRALRSPSEEYRAIVDVVSRYAIRYSEVAFACKRLPDGGGGKAVAGLDVRTAAGATAEANIRAAFGANLAQELVLMEVNMEACGIAARAHATNAGFSMRKGIFVLFINGRLVNCAPLKRAVDAAYAAFLPKGGHAFMYLDVAMRPSDVDVNVHPNKTEVRFLHESQLTEAVVAALESRLKADGTSRTFLAQALITQSGTLARPQLAPSSPPQRPGAVKRPAPGGTFGGRAAGGRGDGGEAGDATGPSGAAAGEGALPRRKRQSRGGGRSGGLIDDEALGGGDDEGDGDVEGEAELSDFINDSDVGDGEDSALSSPLIHLDDGGGGRVISPSDGEDAHSPPPRAGTLTEPEPVARKAAKIASKDKVRTNRVAPVGAMDAYVSHGGAPSVAVDLRKRRQRRPDALPLLTSVRDLIAGLREDVHRGVAGILREHTFVGVVSEKFALVQHQTKLMLVETAPVVTELMYRQILTRFADLDAVSLSPPAALADLIAGAVGDADGEAEPSKVAECVQLLLDRAPLLDEYFSIVVTGTTVADAKMEQLPVVFAGVAPDLASMPEFLISLLDVDWAAERPCLDGVARALAQWLGGYWEPDEASYARRREASPADASRDAAAGVDDAPSQSLEERKEWLLRHVLFESMRFDFDPPAHLADALREVTSTQKLYRIFERC